jgi:hypothetical protein
MATQQEFREATKNRGEAILGASTCGLRGRPISRLTFDLPPLTLYSLALRMSAGKGGVEGWSEG